MTALITSYNYGDYIAAAVDSVLAQDYDGPIEILVVDDGSTDRSLDVLAGYGERIRVVRQTNQGQLMAFRTGIAEARGEILCLLDSDDTWLPEKVGRVVDGFRDPTVQWVAHGVMLCDERLQPRAEIAPAGRKGRVRGDPVLFLERRAGSPTSALSFRTALARRVAEVVDRVAPSLAPRLRHDADRLLLVLAGLHEAAGWQTRKPLTMYRQHERQTFAGPGAALRMLERQIEVDRLVTELSAREGGPDRPPTPLYRHELVRKGVVGEGGRPAVLVQGLGVAAGLLRTDSLLAARQALSLGYAFMAPRRWFRTRLRIPGHPG